MCVVCLFVVDLLKCVLQLFDCGLCALCCDCVTVCSCTCGCGCGCGVWVCAAVCRAFEARFYPSMSVLVTTVVT